MKNNEFYTKAVQQYASAYNTHYTTKDIHEAFRLYEEIINDHPDTKEAGYSRSQLQNIVNTVVPKKKIMDSLMELARIHFDPKVAVKTTAYSA